jgi:O-antigen/teichoic acid export membrane protein
MLRLVLVKIYAKRKYPELDFHAEPKDSALKQKNAALLHQVVGIIVNNTDTTVLTICLGTKSLLEVSVYGVYMMVVNAVNQLMTSFSNGLTAGFGEVIAKNEEETLKKSYSSYEYMYFVIMFIVIACMGVLILPFVGVYTVNLTDVQYVRPLLGFLFTLIVLMQNVRIPGLTIICAAGHYKETRYQAILEAVINITVSLGLVWKLGMAGVLLGTVCSYGYRSFDIVFYTSRHLVKGCAKISLIRIVRNGIAVAFLCIVGTYVIPQNMASFIIWFLYAIGMVAVSVFTIVGVNYVVEPDEFKELVLRVKGILGRKKED